MPSRIQFFKLFRKGPLFFVAAFCLFIFGGIWLNHRHVQQMAELTKNSDISQSLRISGIRSVRIEAKPSDENQIFWAIKVKYLEKATDGAIHYNRFSHRVATRIDREQLVVELDDLGNTRHYNRASVEIHLPFSVASLTSRGLDSLELESDDGKRLPALNFDSLGCRQPSVSIGRLTVDLLEFHCECNESCASQRGAPSLSIGRDADIRSLVAHLPSGHLTIDEHAKVQSPQLHLAPEVMLQAPAHILPRVLLNGAPLGSGSGAAQAGP